MSAPVKQFTICDEELVENSSPINLVVHPTLKMPETLAIIFGFLSLADRGRAAQVCVDWRDACNQLSVWRDAGTTECKLHSGRHIPGAILQRRGIRKFEICQQDLPNLRSTLKEISGSLPNANSLRFNACEQLSDAILLDTFPPTGLPCISFLSVRNCHLLTDASVDLITRVMPNLTIFDLCLCDSITDKALFFISIRLPKVRILDFTNCKNISERGIGYLAGNYIQDGADAIRLLLRSQQLLDSDMTDDEVSGNQCVDKLAFRSSSIFSINFFGCHQVTDQALLHLSRMPNLKRLNLSFCNNVSETGLEYLASMPNSLLYLKLSFCAGVNDMGLLYVGEMPGLRALSLRGCSNISDMGIHVLTPLRPTLRSLDVSACPGLTPQALLIIANRLITLSSLSLDQHNLTAKGLNLSAANPSHLKVIHAFNENGEWNSYDI